MNRLQHLRIRFRAEQPWSRPFHAAKVSAFESSREIQQIGIVWIVFRKRGETLTIRR